MFSSRCLVVSSPAASRAEPRRDIWRDARATMTSRPWFFAASWAARRRDAGKATTSRLRFARYDAKNGGPTAASARTASESRLFGENIKFDVKFSSRFFIRFFGRAGGWGEGKGTKKKKDLFRRGERLNLRPRHDRCRVSRRHARD